MTESDLDNINVRFALEEQIQKQEMKDTGWRFDKTSSMIIYFYKTGEMNGRSYVKIPLGKSAILNIENDDKYCFLWSLLAHLHPISNPKRGHSTRVPNYKQYFNELNIEGFDFSNGFRCSDIHNFEKLNSLSINIFDLSFYQDQNTGNIN